MKKKARNPMTPKIWIKLTPYQMRKLAPIRRELKGRLGGVLGQCHLAKNLYDEKIGTAFFCFLTEKESNIVKPAILEASGLRKRTLISELKSLIEKYEVRP